MPVFWFCFVLGRKSALENEERKRMKIQGGGVTEGVRVPRRQKRCEAKGSGSSKGKAGRERGLNDADSKLKLSEFESWLCHLLVTI